MLNYFIDPVLVVFFAALKDNTPLLTVLRGISNNRLIFVFTDQNPFIERGALGVFCIGLRRTKFLKFSK